MQAEFPRLYHSHAYHYAGTVRVVHRWHVRLPAVLKLPPQNRANRFHDARRLSRS
jgi:hypothetical protein